MLIEAGPRAAPIRSLSDRQAQASKANAPAGCKTAVTGGL